MAITATEQFEIQPRELEFLWHRLGPEKSSLQSVGDRFGITRERVRQIQKKATLKLTRSPVYLAIKQSSEDYYESQGFLSLEIIQRRVQDQIGADEPRLCVVIAPLILEPLHGGIMTAISEFAAVKNRVIAESMLSISRQAKVVACEEGSPKVQLLVERLIIEASNANQNGYSLGYPLMELRDSIVLLVNQATRMSQTCFWSANLAKRILKKANHPMHWREIADQVNVQLLQLGKIPLSVYSIRNELFDKRQWFTRSDIGEWGLSEWYSKPLS